jgi:VWFA-related protein
MLRSLFVGLLSAYVALSQEPPAFRATVNVVVAPTTVVDRQGNYVNDLKPSDFQLLDNGKAQNIKVDVSFIPISLVVAIQANSAVESILPKIKKIGSLLQGELTGEQGEVAILSFDHRLEVREDFTTDGDKIEQALQKIRPGSSSSRMIDAVIQSVRMLQKRPDNHRRVLLLISETRDRGSEGRVRDALQALQFANVAVYTVNINRLVTTVMGKAQPPRPDPIPPTARPLPAGVPPTPSAAAQVSGNATNSANFIPLGVEIFRQVKSIFVDNPVEVFTKWTGGEERHFVSQRDLERAVAQIGDVLHSQYILSYSPNNKEEGGFHEIQVSVLSRPDLKVRTRPGYWMAAKFE